MLQPSWAGMLLHMLHNSCCSNYVVGLTIFCMCSVQIKLASSHTDLASSAASHEAWCRCSSSLVHITRSLSHQPVQHQVCHAMSPSAKNSPIRWEQSTKDLNNRCCTMSSRRHVSMAQHGCCLCCTHRPPEDKSCHCYLDAGKGKLSSMLLTAFSAIQCYGMRCCRLQASVTSAYLATS